MGLTNTTRRRDASLANVRALLAHGHLTGEVFTVPEGKSVIVVTPPGIVSSTLTNCFLRNKEDVNRLVVGHLRPGGASIYVKRFDAGQQIPEMQLERDYGDEKSGWKRNWHAGLFKLPFTAADFARQASTYPTRRPETPLPRNGVRLSEVLALQPGGKYIVTGCRGFADRAADGTKMTDRQKTAIRKLEMETPVLPGRSDPGSLTVEEARVPTSARSVNWLGPAKDTTGHYDSLERRVGDAYMERRGLPLHKSRKMKRLPFDPLRR